MIKDGPVGNFAEYGDLFFSLSVYPDWMPVDSGRFPGTTPGLTCCSDRRIRREIQFAAARSSGDPILTARITRRLALVRGDSRRRNNGLYHVSRRTPSSTSSAGNSSLTRRWTSTRLAKLQYFVRRETSGYRYAEALHGHLY